MRPASPPHQDLFFCLFNYYLNATASGKTTAPKPPAPHSQQHGGGAGGQVLPLSRPLQPRPWAAGGAPSPARPCPPHTSATANTPKQQQPPAGTDAFFGGSRARSHRCPHGPRGPSGLLSVRVPGRSLSEAPGWNCLAPPPCPQRRVHCGAATRLLISPQSPGGVLGPLSHPDPGPHHSPRSIHY